MKRQFEENNLTYYRFTAVDGKKAFQNVEDDYKKGWLACFASHIKLIQKISLNSKLA